MVAVTKQLKINADASKFNRKVSIFKDWKDDSDKVIKEALNHDLKAWKAKRFITDYSLYSKVEGIMRKNFRMLKEIFITASAHYLGPDLNRDPFDKFCESSKILDGRAINVGVLNTLFKATNFEVVDQDNN